MKETSEQRNQRLADSGPLGRVLLDLINEYGSISLMAEKTGITKSAAWRWAEKGKISMRGATTLAEKLGRKREEFRPDLTAEQWNSAFRGPVPGQAKKEHSGDIKILLSTAYKFGGTKKFCAEIGASITNYHCWKTRGKVPPQWMEKVKELAAR